MKPIQKINAQTSPNLNNAITLSEEKGQNVCAFNFYNYNLRNEKFYKNQ